MTRKQCNIPFHYLVMITLEEHRINKNTLSFSASENEKDRLCGPNILPSDGEARLESSCSSVLSESLERNIRCGRCVTPRGTEVAGESLEKC